MSSPERREETPHQEGEPKSYLLAARYPNERASERPYNEAQQAIWDDRRLDLSVYRLQLPHATKPEYVWHVAFVGEQPPVAADQRFRRILSTGELIELPAKVLGFLRQRRAEASKLGNWVEGHYKPGIRRRLK